MKKILTILLTVLLLAGCGSSGAKKAVEDSLKNYKELIEATASLTSTAESSVESEYSLAFVQTIYDFDYEIKSIEEKDNAASATVVIKTVNLANMLTKYGEDAEVVEAGQKLDAETDEEKAKEYVAILINKLKELGKETPKDYETEVVIPLVKENGEWSVDSSFDLNSILSSAILASALESGE